MEPVVHGCGTARGDGVVPLVQRVSKFVGCVQVYMYSMCRDFKLALELLFSVPIHTLVLMYLVPAEFCGCDYQQIFPCPWTLIGSATPKINVKPFSLLVVVPIVVIHLHSQINEIVSLFPEIELVVLRSKVECALDYFFKLQRSSRQLAIKRWGCSF